jgi:hypothetical protein
MPQVYRAARVAEIAVGLFFLFAAILKVQDIHLFVAQIYAYQVVQAPPLLALVALVTVGVETFLGVALVLGLRLWFLPHLAVQAMLVVFTGLIIYAWQVHGLTDCGCFGGVKVPPEQGIAKNLLTMLVAGAAWFGLARCQPDSIADAPAWTPLRLGPGVLAGLLAVGFSVPGVYGNAEPLPDPVPAPGGAADAGAPPAASGPFSRFTVTSDVGESFPLGRGTHLVAMLSMTCEHCMAIVPTLNDLAMRPELPPLVALGWEPNPGDFEQFRLLTGAQFPMHNLGSNFLVFAELIGSEPPRLALVRDGQLLQHWDGDPPDFETLLAAVNNPAAASVD